MRAHTAETQASVTPEKALQLLKDGNSRFINNLKLNRNLLEQVNDTREGQWPFACILSCIDSRTSAELIFDQGLGDIFSIRIAGNFANQDILGSMEFACKVAGSKLVVVLGHSKCGALKGGIDAEKVGGLGLENLSHLVYHFDSCVKAVIEPGELRSSSNTQLLEKVTFQNVRQTLEDIRNQSASLSKMEKQGEIMIVGAVYDVETGEVSWLD
jgi:carbonic anhydrase